jgi:hypothetical protein
MKNNLLLQMKTLPMIGKNCPREKNRHENPAALNNSFDEYLQFINMFVRGKF